MDYTYPSYKFPSESDTLTYLTATGNEQIFLDGRKKISLNEARQWFQRENTWIQISGFTTTANVDKTITTSRDYTSYLFAGMALKIRQLNGVTPVITYGYVTAVTATTITFLGEDEFNVSYPITNLYYTYEQNLVTIDIDLFDASCFDTATNTNILATKQRTPRRCNGGRLVYAEVSCYTDDTGTNSYINVMNAANPILLDNTNKGLEIAGSAYGTYNKVAFSIDSTYANLPNGNLRIDTTNAGNKNTENAVLTLVIIPKSMIY